MVSSWITAAAEPVLRTVSAPTGWPRVNVADTGLTWNDPAIAELTAVTKRTRPQAAWK
jgi:hypothetical protein